MKQIHEKIATWARYEGMWKVLTDHGLKEGQIVKVESRDGRIKTVSLREELRATNGFGMIYNYEEARMCNRCDQYLEQDDHGYICNECRAKDEAEDHTQILPMRSARYTCYDRKTGELRVGGCYYMEGKERRTYCPYCGTHRYLDGMLDITY